MSISVKVPKILKNNSLVILFLFIVFTSVFVSSYLIQKPKEVKTGLGAIPGDVNSDGVVDIIDFQLLSNSFGKTSGQSGYNVNADFNHDNVVDILDFQVLSNNFGHTGTTTITPTLRITTTPTLTLPPPPPGGGMWISHTEIMNLPTSGNAWDSMRSAAYGGWGTADLKNQDNKFGLNVLAGAFVWARTGDSTLRSKVRDGIITAKRTMDESSEWQTTNGALSLGRQLGAFVISADLIDLKNFDPGADTEFRNYLRVIRTTNVGTHGRWKSLTYTCENSANNWGTFACPSRIAASIYLGDTADVQRSANIMRAWMGERSYYPADAPGQNGYFEPTAGNTSGGWWCNQSTWTAVNPSCIKLGVNIDGALAEDASRGGGCCTLQGDGIMYSWEVMQGTYVSAELLYRTGNFGNPYSWSNNALKRAMDFLQRSGWNITNPGKYVPWMANKRYNTHYPVTSTVGGRIMSWGDWLYQ